MGYFSTTDFSLLSAPPKPKGGDGDFVRGVKQSWQELQGTAAGAVGLAGAGLGIDRMKDWGLETAEEKFAKSAAMGKPSDSLEGIEGIGDAVDWTQRGLGYVGGQALPALLSGGIGTIVGKKLVEKGIQELLKKGLKDEAEKLATKAMMRGAAAGAGAASYGQEAGSIYSDMVKEGHDEPGRAALFAAPAAALDVLPQMRAAKAILDPAKQATLKGMRRVGVETGKQAGAEGLTEATQTAIERAAAYKDLNSADAWLEYANAAALGALGGGVLGGGSELVLGKDPIDLTKPGGAPGTESGVPGAKPAAPAGAELGISRKTPYDPLARELQTPAAPGEAAPPLVPPGAPPVGPIQPPPTEAPSLGISRTLRDQYGIAVEKQSRGELLSATEAALLQDPPTTPKIALDTATPVENPQILGPNGLPIGTAPQVITGGRVVRATPTAPEAPAPPTAPAAPSWKQVARRTFIGAKGRGKAIQTVMAADNPQAAAQIAREAAYASTSSAEVRALDAVHQALTGETFAQYDAADMERARQISAPPEIKTVVDEKANEAATSKLNDTPQPTQEAAEAGKYKKGKLEVAGVKMDIENPAGSVRRGVGEDGKAWESTLATHYGYVPGTVAFDSTKDEKQGVDVMIKPGTAPEWTGQVFVVNQNKADGTFDEHKAVFGAASADEARELYLANYPRGQEQRIRSIVPMDPKAFSAWAKDKGPSGPKAGALKLNRDLTQGAEKAQPPVKVGPAEKEWNEEYRTKDDEPKFADLSATHKERWAQAVEDGYANGELFDEISRDTRAVKLADEIKQQGEKSEGDLDGRGRAKSRDGVPPAFLETHMVKTRAFDTETGKFVQTEMPAKEALDSVKGDLKIMRALLKCVKGG